MTANHGNRNDIETLGLGSATLGGAEVPTRVVLAPWGKVESQKGVFYVDEESAHAVVRAFQEHGTDLPIDYEHQTLGGAFASPDGKAPAAGWIRALTAEPGVGIIGHIEWTQQGRDMLAAREYRYLSPVALIRKSDRKLVGIHSAALTNKPAIVAMESIVHREEVPGVTDEEALSLIRLRAELHLSDEAQPREVLIAAHQRLKELSEAARIDRADQRITAAMRAGKLTAGQREWAQSLLDRDESLFEEWFATAPIVVALGATTPPNIGESDAPHRAAVARARAEYRSNRALSQLTTEEAYVADAVRQV